MSSLRTITIKLLRLRHSSHPRSPSIQRPSPYNFRQTHMNNESDEAKERKKSQKPLDILFKEAVGLTQNPQICDMELKRKNESNDLIKKLWELELQVRKLKAESEKNVVVNKDETKARNLFEVFTRKPVEAIKEKPVLFKDLSPDMEMFLSHLHKEGYFKDANFLPGYKLDFSCFQNGYGHDFIKFAADKFGKDHQEIAKWLSGNDLKTIALFGCPSLAKKYVFAAKTLRRFLGIQEDTVCSKCMIKTSCKFVNQSVWKAGAKNLHLAGVLRVITMYAMDSVPPQLVVPDEVKASVSRLLKEAVDLSQTVH